LAAAIEDRLGIVRARPARRSQTLGGLRRLAGKRGNRGREQRWRTEARGARERGSEGARRQCNRGQDQGSGVGEKRSRTEIGTAAKPFPVHNLRSHGRRAARAAATALSILSGHGGSRSKWLRVAFIEAVMRPLTRLLAAPASLLLPSRFRMGRCSSSPTTSRPSTGRYRCTRCPRHTAAGWPRQLMARCSTITGTGAIPIGRRDTKASTSSGRRPTGWPRRSSIVFPLPRQRDFQRSFAHAGKALDRGYNAMIFPEGTRSAVGPVGALPSRLGLLVKEELRARASRSHRGWASSRPRARLVPVRHPRGADREAIRFAPEETEADITPGLHDEVERLMGNAGSKGAS